MSRHAFICAIFLLNALNLTSGLRRIVGGEVPQQNKRYMVYLLKAEDSPVLYDAWICGGSIVSPEYIVTSAACVEDVKYMYAIAGYNRYVRAEDLNADLCTKEKKKKIVYVCIPKAYELDYPDVQKWAWVDIAVAKVESPYNFNDESYKIQCSYIPQKIEINYVKKYQQELTDAFVLGWGHTRIWRSQSDYNDYNSPVLLGTAVQIGNKTVCKTAYSEDRPLMAALIDKFMICVTDEGNIDTGGKLKQKLDITQLKDGCELEGVLRGTGLCEDEVPALKPRGSRGIEGKAITIGGIVYVKNETFDNLTSAVNKLRSNDEPVLNGFCQIQEAHLETFYLGKNINILSDSKDDGKNNTRRIMCDQLPEEGIHLVERRLSWMNHRDGPAANEMLKERPQLPLNG